MDHNAAISNYLKRVGVRRYPSFQTFQKYLERQYGADLISELFDVIDRRGQGEDIDVYPLLYSSLDLSIDFLGFEGDLHANFLRWQLRQYADISGPSRILDLGCGNGVLSCFYANHFPGSEVVGIDSSAEGVGCAEELKRRLNLTNLQFIQGDFIDSGLSNVAGDFDLITAVKSVGTAIALPEFDQGVPLLAVVKQFLDSAKSQLLKEIRGRLTPSGVLITMDPWTSIQSFCWWACSLNNAGFRIDFDNCGRVEYQVVTDDKRDRIPVLWSKIGDSSKDHLTDAIGFWLHANYTENWAKLKTFDFQHELAEMAFAFVNPKIFRFGIKSEHIEGGILWREIWQAGPFLLVYQFANSGYRQLEVLPSMFYESAEERVRDLATRDPEGTSVSTYDTPHFSWESTKD